LFGLLFLLLQSAIEDKQELQHKLLLHLYAADELLTRLHQVTAQLQSHLVHFILHEHIEALKDGFGCAVLRVENLLEDRQGLILII